MRSTLSRLAILTLVLLAALGVGCGHSHHSEVTVTVTPGTYEPFTLTLVNQTNQSLVPGPIDAPPYSINVPVVVIPAGGTGTIEIGYLPSSITVGATAVGNGPSFVYPTHTLWLGVDYFENASGATFIYR